MLQDWDIALVNLSIVATCEGRHPKFVSLPFFQDVTQSFRVGLV